MLNILVTGAGGGVGQGIIKSLKMIKDIPMNIIAADMSELAAGNFFADKAVLLPSSISDEYSPELIQVFKKNKVDFYFPGTDIELKYCSEKKQLFKDQYGVNTVVSSLGTVEIADDKFKTAYFLKENNFSFPETIYANEADPKKIKFPIILKPAKGYRSIGVFKIENEEELSHHDLKKKNLILQELIGTEEEEYTCTIVKANGKLSPVLALKRILRSGDTYRATPVQSKIIESYIHSIAERLEIDGGCNFQLRLDESGNPKVFEINSRFSGTTPFCAQLGFNPVEYYLKTSLGESYTPQIDYNSQILRYWSEIVVEKNSVKKLKQDKLITKPNFKYFDISKT